MTPGRAADHVLAGQSPARSAAFQRHERLAQCCQRLQHRALVNSPALSSFSKPARASGLADASKVSFCSWSTALPPAIRHGCGASPRAPRIVDREPVNLLACQRRRDGASISVHGGWAQLRKQAASNGTRLSATALRPRCPRLSLRVGVYKGFGATGVEELSLSALGLPDSAPLSLGGEGGGEGFFQLCAEIVKPCLKIGWSAGSAPMMLSFIVRPFFFSLSRSPSARNHPKSVSSLSHGKMDVQPPAMDALRRTLPDAPSSGASCYRTGLHLQRQTVKNVGVLGPKAWAPLQLAVQRCALSWPRI